MCIIRRLLLDVIRLRCNNGQLANHARNKMPFCATHDLILAWLGGRSEGCGDGFTGFRLDLPIDIALIFVAEIITDGLTEIHDDEFMNHRSIIDSGDGNFLPGGDDGTSVSEDKFHHIHFKVCGRPVPTTSSNYEHTHKHDRAENLSHIESPFLVFRIKLVYIFLNHFQWAVLPILSLWMG